MKPKEYNISLRCGDLEVTVLSDGTITSALGYVPAFDIWVDVMEQVQATPSVLRDIEYELDEQLNAYDRGF